MDCEVPLKIVSVALTTALAAVTAVAAAVGAQAAPLPLDASDTQAAAESNGSDQPLLSCPAIPGPEDPMAAIPPRDPLCGENDMELTNGIYLRSNAYPRLSTIYGPDVTVSIIGNNHYQLRDHAGNLILGEDGSTLHHIPFGREIPPPMPGNTADLTPHEQAIREGVSRVTVGVMPGVVYTGDLTDMSAYLTTPIGSLIVQAPGTGPDPLQPGPDGQRQVQLLNNFQALDAQGRYVMGNTLTLGSPMALWPNAAVPCPIGTVPISQLPTRADLAAGNQPRTAAELPDPVCKAPASVPIATAVDDPAQPAPGPKPQNDPVQRQKDINDAFSAVGTQFGLAVALGGVLGGALGLAVGCLAGGIGAGTAGTFSAALAGTATGFAGGCLTGAAILGAMGGTIGSLVLGVPVGIVSGINAYNTLRLQGDVARKPIAAATAPAPAVPEFAALPPQVAEAVQPLVDAVRPALTDISAVLTPPALEDLVPPMLTDALRPILAPSTAAP
ncbi:hypothetical protein [Nocardia huaxiensis]|uniref:Uncharacterized protein n=1 Tax=Nocardia huaxiensis TaxID=2755382 RepID=A0A7D6Z6B7_9NOCA|nr:hypothetical protein [Nocardia huaxiensis]QLY32684.1 hypothetical protein H0264_10890 [Nocardia huaxiensis]UFS93581.1 hypothetical protein LPY97_22480 [Nocardia huaxiensis]